MTRALIGYSWGIINIGSIAIAPGLAHLLQSVRPGTEVTVLTSQSAADPEMGFVKEYYAERFPQIKLVPTPFVEYLGAQSATRAWRRMAERFGADLEAIDRGSLPEERACALIDYVLDEFAADVVQEMDEAGSPALQAFREADFYCYTSGTMLNFGRAGKREFWTYTLKWALPLVVARHLGLRYGVYAHSFEMIAPPSDYFYRRLFADAAFLMFRDGESKNYIHSLGIRVPGMSYRPDSAFYFPLEDDEYAETFLKRHGLTKERFVAVVIRTGAQDGPLTGVMPSSREEQHMALLREFIERWTAQTGMKVLLCPEVQNEIATMRVHIYDKLSSEARAQSVWMDTFWMPEEAKAVYARARIVCSMEVHSIVHAIAAGTPVLHPQFWESGRKAWMLRDLGLGDWLQDIDAISADELVSKALEIDANFAQAKARVVSARRLIERLGSEAVDLIYDDTDESSRHVR